MLFKFYKLKVRLHNNSKNKNKVKNLISKYLNINPNYILIENKKIRNLKRLQLDGK